LDRLKPVKPFWRDYRLADNAPFLTKERGFLLQIRRLLRILYRSIETRFQANVVEYQRMTPDERQKLIEKLAVGTKKLAEPVNFADLEKKGALIKDGAWYRIPDSRILPENIMAKVRAIAQDSKG
jgi:hypothetical protein